jgi:hypothetical protein
MPRYLYFISLLLLVLAPYTGTCGLQVSPISKDFQIGKIKLMLERVPAGAYISVGGERSFRGASLASQINRVYMLDIAPEIIQFNKINKELLRAPNRETYLHLRWKAPYDDWRKLNLSLTQDDFKWWEHNIRNLKNMNYPLPEALNIYQSDPETKNFGKIWDKLTFIYQTWKNKDAPNLPQRQFIESVTYEQLKDLEKKLNISINITPEDWTWWTKFGKNKALDCPKTWLANPSEVIDLGQVVNYKSGNYLFDDRLYAKLHDLAIKGNLILVKIDLKDKKQVERFMSILDKSKDTIAVLDLNNLFREDHIGDKQYKHIINNLLVYGRDNSLLIVTNNDKDYACAQFQSYIGFTFENIVHWPPYFDLQTFFATLPKHLLNVIDGRVYEKEETPPYQYLLRN